MSFSVLYHRYRKTSIFVAVYREAIWTCFFYGNETGETTETTALKGNEYSYNYKFPVGSEDKKNRYHRILI